jgi:hypothetical protein
MSNQEGRAMETLRRIKRTAVGVLVLGIITCTSLLGVHQETHGGAINPQPLPPIVHKS